MGESRLRLGHFRPKTRVRDDSLLIQNRISSSIFQGQLPDRVLWFPQVRRMVGALVAVGQGKLVPQDIQELLEVKDARAFPPHAMAPASGLFLKSVEYRQAGG